MSRQIHHGVGLYEFNIDTNIIAPLNLDIRVGGDSPHFQSETRLRFKVDAPPRPLIEAIMGTGGRRQLPFQMRQGKASHRLGGYGPWSKPGHAIAVECSYGGRDDERRQLTMELLLLRPDEMEAVEPLTAGRPRTSEATLSAQSREMRIRFRRSDSTPYEAVAETFETYNNGMMFATFLQPYQILYDYIREPTNGARFTVQVGGVELSAAIRDVGFDSTRLHLDIMNRGVVSDGDRRRRREGWRGPIQERPLPPRPEPPPAPPARRNLPHIPITRQPIVIPLHNIDSEQAAEEVIRRRNEIDWGDDRVDATTIGQLFGMDLAAPDNEVKLKRKKKPKNEEEPKGPKRMFRLEDDE